MSLTEARASHSICQGERWERVVCKLEQRRGAYRVLLQKPHVCFVEVCRRHVPLPVQASQGTKALLRVPQKPQNNEQKHCNGLFKELLGTTILIAACAVFYWARGRFHCQNAYFQAHEHLGSAPSSHHPVPAQQTRHPVHKTACHGAGQRCRQHGAQAHAVCAHA
jgi:hypothetical protein